MLNLTSNQTDHALDAGIAKDSLTTTAQNDPRKSIDLHALSFPSYMSLCTLIFVCLGVVSSVLFFLLDIAGLNTAFQWGPFSFSDTESGIVVLFVGPFIFGVTGLIGSLFSYRLFLWALHQFWGLLLTGTWKELEGPGDPKSNNPTM